MEKHCAAALGFFDGVHRGHLAVLRAASGYAHAHGLESVAVTFDRLPKTGLSDEETPLLCTDGERARIIREEADVDRVLVLPFDEKLRAMEARDFIERVVLGGLGAVYVAAGYDFRFGAGARGDAALLREVLASHGAACGIVERMDDGGEKISSTRIRGQIAAGDVRSAARLLSRPFSVEGEVVHGKAMGRRFGFPTMNIPWPRELVLPAAGVYVCEALFEGARHDAVCNIAHGERPLLEAHVLSFSGDVYGERARIELLDYLRPMRRFPDFEALARQVDRDRKAAEYWFSSR